MHRARLVSLDESILSVRMVGRAVKFASALAFAALAFALDAQAAVTPEEATALGTTLTGIGA